MNKAKLCLVLHFVFLCAFLVIFITVGGDDYVRWNLDAILFVGTILSALAWLRLTRHEKTDNSIYKYLLLYSTFGIIVALFMSIVLGFWLNMKGEKIAEDSDYVIRKEKDGLIPIDPNLFKLYEKNGIYERYVTTLTSDNFIYNMKSVKFHKEMSAVSFKLELTDVWKKEWSDSPSDTVSHYHVLPIYEAEFNRHPQEIDSLKKELNCLEEE